MIYPGSASTLTSECKNSVTFYASYLSLIHPTFFVRTSNFGAEADKMFLIDSQPEEFS